jgi:hypothetical protein
MHILSTCDRIRKMRHVIHLHNTPKEPLGFGLSPFLLVIEFKFSLFSLFSFNLLFSLIFSNSFSFKDLLDLSISVSVLYISQLIFYLSMFLFQLFLFLFLLYQSLLLFFYLSIYIYFFSIDHFFSLLFLAIYKPITILSDDDQLTFIY